MTCLLLATGHAFHVPSQIRHETTALQAEDDARRSFLATSVAAATSFMLPSMPAKADGVDYKAVAADIMDLVKADPDKGPSK